MKLTALFLTVFLFNLSAASVSQTIRFSGKNVSLEAIFSAVEQQTKLVFFYSPETIEGTAAISIEAKDMPLQSFLEQVFINQPLKYDIRGGTIYIVQKQRMAENKLLDLPKDDSSNALNQEAKIIVTTTNNMPLSGASVTIKGTNKVVMTDAKGLAKVKIAVNDVLVISYIGFIAQELVIKDNNISQSSFLITLERSASQLDEVQILPYGKTTRRYLTGSISTVKAADIERQPVMNILQALQGKVPGLLVAQTSGNSAAPIKVEIRGRSSINPNALSTPLYVIDGIPLGILEIGSVVTPNGNGMVQAGLTNTVGENPLLYMNPRDIESVDVLKDADATAIYGSRGANGVILITTKKSKPGPTRFNMNINRGTTNVRKKLDLLHTSDYLAIRREAFKNDNIVPTIYNAPDLMLWSSTDYTDWQREMIGTGEQLSIDANIGGGNGQTSYQLGVNYHSQLELMNNNGKNKRGGINLGINHTNPNQKLKVLSNTRLSLIDVHAYNIGSNLYLPPNAPAVYDDMGKLNFVPWRGQSSSNFPFSGMLQPSESATKHLSNSANISYELINGLTIGAVFGYNYSQNSNAKFTPAASKDPAFPGAIALSVFGNSVNSSWTAEPQVSFSNYWGKGYLSVQVGSSFQSTSTEGFTNIGMMYPNDHLINSVNNATRVETTHNKGDYKYNAIFSILNFRWDGKYVLNLSARRDGSSRFGPGKQFGNFGSVGIAWIATEEAWMKESLPEWFSFLKFRGSIGIAGNDAIGDYEYLSRWSTSYDLKGFDGKIYNYNGLPGFTIVRAVNQDFQWEATRKMELGATIGLFNDRINIEAAYYENQSGSQLTNLKAPQYSGFSSVLGNWDAVVRNSGLECTFTATLLQTKNWNGSLYFNIGKNNNKLASYPGLSTSAYRSTYEIGQSLSTRYYYKYTGIDPVTGNYTFEDHNKDGNIYSDNLPIATLASDDRYLKINTDPTFFGGFGSTIQFSNFSLLAQFSFNKQLGKDPFITLVAGGNNNLILPKEVADNHWQQPGDLAKYPRYTTMNNLGADVNMSDAAFTNASFVKLNSLSISYDLPKQFITKIKMNSCRFMISTQNLFTITSYKGLDPEIQSFTHASPLPRIVVANLTFQF